MEQLLLLISTPFYMLIIGLEIALSHYHRIPAYSWKDTLYNASFMLLNGGIDLAFRAVYVLAFSWFFAHKLMVWEQPSWLYWTCLVVGMDFLFYWLHWVDHQSRLFWAVHVTHHSSEKFNFTVGFRSSVFQPIYRFVYFIPLALAGFQPLDIVFIFSATQIWGIIVHTEYIHKLGWLEYILVTPSHHRVHHASNTLYLDRNFGMLLIIWDRMFGTFQEEITPPRYEPIRYGLTTPLDDRGLLHAIFHEWAGIGRDLRKQVPLPVKLKYLLGPPGWSHDGSSKTSQQIREAEQDQ